MYLVNTLVAGATAVEIRNLTIDHTNDKVEFNGHGFANGDLVRASQAKAGLAVDTMYVVDSATTNDFKLKTFKAADATGETAVTLTTETAATDMTLTKYGSKKCNITDAKTADNKVTCAAQSTFKKADKLMIYCPQNTGDKCKIDGNGNADLAHAKNVWAGADDQTSFTLAKVAPTNGTAGTAITIAANIHDDTKAAGAKPWLLSVDSGSIYPVAAKTLGSDGQVWSSNAGMCGNAACSLTTATLYWYTVGGTATAGLTDKHVYNAVVASATPWKFELNDSKAATAGGLEAKDANAVAVTASGAGNSYKKIAHAANITKTAKTTNKVTCKGKTVTEFADDTAVTYYCPDATADACKYNITGAANGSEFKVKSGANATGEVDIVLKGTTGTDAIVVTDDSTKTGAHMLIMDSGAAVIFPPAAAAGGSAARSFAMLGSAFAMATAFLLA